MVGVIYYRRVRHLAGAAVVLLDAAVVGVVLVDMITESRRSAELVTPDVGYSTVFQCRAPVTVERATACIGPGIAVRVIEAAAIGVGRGLPGALESIADG